MFVSASSTRSVHYEYCKRYTPGAASVQWQSGPRGRRVRSSAVPRSCLQKRCKEQSKQAKRAVLLIANTACPQSTSGLPYTAVEPHGAHSNAV
jgi:hypothetical protein